MALVTVLTATYNREENIKELFDSLQDQNSYNFVWMIVDDGSKDNTEEVILSFKKVAKFDIIYIKKENGGKHTAMNVGVKECTTELTIIVDSDDTLFPEAIKIIESYYEKYKENKDIGVFSFLKAKKDGIAVVKAPRDEFVGSYIETRIVNSLPGDMAEVFYTHTLKEFPFPEFKGEKFLSEDVVWIQIGEKYKYVFINKAIYQCEYLVGGLTASDKKVKFASPLGSMMRGKMLMKSVCGLKANIKGAIIYNCYRIECKTDIPKILHLSSLYERLLVFVTYPMGVVFHKKWNVN